MIAEPCRCSGPNPYCRRAGTSMTGRLWEICAGVNVDPVISAKYRALWDSLVAGKAIEDERIKIDKNDEHVFSSKPAISLPCINLGEVVREQEPCGCGEKLRYCDVYQACRSTVKRDGVPSCRGCAAYETTSEVIRYPSLRAYVVTIPGREIYLNQTLESFRMSDWDDAPQVYTQPKDMPIGWESTSATYLRVLELALQSDSDWSLVVEDDVIVSRYIRSAINHFRPIIWGHAVFVNLYFPDLLSSELNGNKHHVRVHDEDAYRIIMYHGAGDYRPPRTWGSQAYLFHRSALRVLVKDWQSHSGGQDARVLGVMRRRGVPHYLHWPSLVQHMQAPSAFGTPTHRAACFDENFRPKSYNVKVKS